MSTLDVKIYSIDNIIPHSNADNLEICLLGGWRTITQKNAFSIGEKVVFLSPDAIIPSSLHKFLNISSYCGKLPKSHDLSSVNARKINAANLRGEPSFGTIFNLETLQKYCNLHSLSCNINDENIDLISLLNIVKWEPPPKVLSGDEAKEISDFHKYTNIENWRKYPNIFDDFESVVLTEKIHGCCCRLGYMIDPDDNTLKFMAGSSKLRRKEGQSLYWSPLEMYPQIKELLTSLYNSRALPIIIFGEIFGYTQDMHYGLSNGQNDFRMFDISIGGKYVSFPTKKELATSFNIPIVPILYTGPYSKKVVEDFTNGKAFAYNKKDKFIGREGVVITSYIETIHPEIGRKILKSVSANYLARKGAIDNGG